MRNSVYFTILKFSILILLPFILLADPVSDKNTEFDASSLKVNWWESFINSPLPLNTKAHQLQHQIESVLPTMTETEQPEAKKLIDRSAVYLDTLIKLQESASLPIPQATPVSDTYPLDELMEIARTHRSEYLELKNLREEKDDRTSQIEVHQDLVDNLNRDYFKETARSEKHYLMGLKLINAQLALYIDKLELAKINTAITGYEKFLKLNQEEIKIAQSRLVSTPDELARLEKAKDTAHEQWKESVEVYTQKEKERTAQTSRGDRDNTNAKTQLFDQELMQASITEMLAHQLYLQLELKLGLVRLINENNENEAIKLSGLMKGWEKDLNEVSKKRDELDQIAKRQAQRSAQLISIGNPADSGQPKDSIHQQVLQLAQNNLLSLQRIKSEIEDSHFLESQLQTRISAAIGGSKLFFNDVSEFFKSLWTSFAEWVEDPFFHFGNIPISMATVLKFLVSILITLWGSKKITDYIANLASTRKSIDKSVLYRISRLAYYFLLTLGLLISLALIGFDFSSFILIAGALGVGLGFGLQTIFNNFISGLILLFESHVKVGDYVEIASGVRGEVKEINVRSTIIAISNGVEVIVPNAEMISNRVTNWTLAHPYHRMKIPFTVSYGSDKDLVRRVVTEAALKVTDTLIKPGFADPSVYLAAFGPLGLDFELYVWLNEKHSRMPGKSLSDYLWAIEDSLRQNKIDIPFPRTEIKML